MREKAKSYIQYLNDGCKLFFPILFFTGKEKLTPIRLKGKWGGRTREEFADLIIVETGKSDLLEAIWEVKRWKDVADHGRVDPTMPPQDILEKAAEIQEEVEKAPNEFIRENKKKEALLQAQQHIEKTRTQTKVTTKAPTEISQPPPTPPVKISVPSTTEDQPGIVLQAISKTNINPLNRVYLGVSTLPFRLAAPSIAAESPQGHVTATAQHMLFQNHITSSSFVTARPKALSLGINPKTFDNLLKEIAIQERAFPGLYRRIASGYGIQEIIVKVGVPQAVAGQLFLTPSQQAGSLVMPRRSFLGNIFSRAGSQLFGKAFKGFAKKKAVAGAASKVATTIAKLEPHVKVAAWITQGLSAIVNFIKGKSGDKSGTGGTLLTVGLLAGGFILLPIIPLLGAISLGAGGLTGLGLAANKAGGYGNLGTQAGGFGQAALTGLTSIVVPALAGPILFALIGIPLIIALIIFIINSGAYIVPPKVAIAGLSQSAYIGVEKTAEYSGTSGPSIEMENNNLPATVTYVIKITAKKGTLTDITFESTCETIKEGIKPNCTPPDNIIAGVEGNLEEKDSLPTTPPIIISPVDPYIITYTQTYTAPNFQDTFVIDTFTVTAKADGRSGEQSAASATVKIGNPPEECPLDWPISLPQKGLSQLPLTQGPNGGYSHLGAEAIDIGTSYKEGFSITARHSGIVTRAQGEDSGPYGKHVEISSICQGRPFISRYAHLSIVSVTNGQTVALGHVVGLSGNTGSSSGPHLHYEFRGPEGRKGPFPNNPPYMAPRYIPKAVNYGCSGSCGSIP